MPDSRMVQVPFNEPSVWTCRFKGAGTNSIPLAVASTSKKMSISTYSNVGAMVVSTTDPVGVVQAYQFWVASPLIGGANAKSVLVTPPTANTNTFSLQVQYANGVAIDLATTEELVGLVWGARTSVP